MKKGICAGAALIAGLSASRAVDAQINPRVYCLDRSTCYAAAFQFQDYLTRPRPHTLFSVYLQNLQGSFSGSNPQYGLNFFSFSWLNQMNPTPTGVVRYVGARGARAQSEGKVRKSEYRHLSHNVLDLVNLDEQFEFATNFGVLGCARPPFLVGNEWSYRTCPNAPFNGFVRMDFRIRARDYSTGGEPLWTTTRMNDFQFGFGGCRVGRDIPGLGSNNCSEFAYDAFVTPEPATMGLMGLGLAGVAAMRTRRRRKRANR